VKGADEEEGADEDGGEDVRTVSGRARLGREQKPNIPSTVLTEEGGGGDAREASEDSAEERSRAKRRRLSQ
jgi:hypothetical protein